MYEIDSYGTAAGFRELKFFSAAYVKSIISANI